MLDSSTKAHPQEKELQLLSEKWTFTTTQQREHFLSSWICQDVLQSTSQWIQFVFLCQNYYLFCFC